MTDQIYPVTFDWTGEAMVPVNPAAADRQYVVGERYRLIPYEERSEASHRQYFAAINEAWKHLPDHAAEHFPTPDHLRKWSLIMEGYRDERTIACASKSEAQRIAAFIKPMDDYAVVISREALVVVYTAKSQSMKAMGKKDFQESKAKVLERIAGMIGVTAEEARQNAGQAA